MYAIFTKKKKKESGTIVSKFELTAIPAFK